MSSKAMYRCEQCRSQLLFYLDNELTRAEKSACEAHLKSCIACREVFNRERWFLESIRKARPLHTAPAELRSRIEAMMAKPVVADDRGRRRSAGRRSLAMAAAVFLLLVGVWAGSAMLSTHQSATSFAMMAVDTHQRHVFGRLPLELDSAEPERISAWFAGKVPFQFTLPNYPQEAGRNKLYQLQGARLVGFQDDYAAYVAYRMGQRPISLVVTSSTVAEPVGGEEIVSRGLTFHYETIAGFKVITWSHRGLTYALVSDFEERGQQTCLVCHQEGVEPP